MKTMPLVLALLFVLPCWASTDRESRLEAEYYVAAYAAHYGVPVGFVRALVEQESGWKRCAISRKGAAGLMQLMPHTARELHVQDRCDMKQNISGGVRHLARLMTKFHGDLRLVAAAYYAGEGVIEIGGLRYANFAVVTYVASIRERVERQKRIRNASVERIPGRTR